MSCAGDLAAPVLSKQRRRPLHVTSGLRFQPGRSHSKEVHAAPRSSATGPAGARRRAAAARPRRRAAAAAPRARSPPRTPGRRPVRSAAAACRPAARRTPARPSRTMLRPAVARAACTAAWAPGGAHPDPDAKGPPQRGVAQRGGQRLGWSLQWRPIFKNVHARAGRRILVSVLCACQEHKLVSV